jgi:hypothetical protein
VSGGKLVNSIPLAHFHSIFQMPKDNKKGMPIYEEKYGAGFSGNCSQ